MKTILIIILLALCVGLGIYILNEKQRHTAGVSLNADVSVGADKNPVQEVADNVADAVQD